MPSRIICRSRDAVATLLSEAEAESASLDFTVTAYVKVIAEAASKILSQKDDIERSANEPVFFSIPFQWQGYVEIHSGYYNVWIYKNRMFEEKFEHAYTEDEKKLLVMEEFDKERRQFEKLRSKFERAPNSLLKRQKISSEVRIFVWQRDNGCCVVCGSNENLEYDHIIPFTKGGSNTERNIQLLCENCNRLKSDRIQ